MPYIRLTETPGLVVLVPKVPENNTNTAKKTFLKIFDIFTVNKQLEDRELVLEPPFLPGVFSLFPLYRGEYLMDKYAVCGIQRRIIIKMELSRDIFRLLPHMAVKPKEVDGGCQNLGGYQN